MDNKRRQRLNLIRSHCKELKRKRYARAYKRFTKTRSKDFELSAEADALQSWEVNDKNLNREYYYGQSETPECVRLNEKTVKNVLMFFSNP